MKVTKFATMHAGISCTVNVTLLFPYSYSMNPSNFGSVASTWHFVFAFFSFRGNFATLSLYPGIFNNYSSSPNGL